MPIRPKFLFPTQFLAFAFKFALGVFREFLGFSRFFFSYLRWKVVILSRFFEQNKNVLVRFFTIKRGRYNRAFLHLALMLVLAIGIVVSPFLAETFPIFSSNTSSLEISSPSANQSILVGEDAFQTSISQKPRDKVITYKVERGDTLSTIARKFDISLNTIRWANDLYGDALSVGDELKILPVTGIAHKVSKGESVYAIAKKLDTNAQKIVDFPFNDFANPETFALVEGQILVVPDGVKPSEQPFIKRQVYLAQGPSTFSSFGFTWPLRGIVSQFAAWYHLAIDIAAPIGAPVVAAHSGVVSAVVLGTWDGGYGNSVYVQNGSIETHYAHLAGANVSVGQEVTGGSTILGWNGMSGRTTGPHVHFEVRKNGALVNPLAYLQ